MSFARQVSQTGAPESSHGLLRGGPLVAGVEVSVLVSESHNLTANVSRLALESGMQVSDHMIVDPDDVTVVFSMTNAGNGSDAARDAFETFRRMRDERELVDLVTEHHVYENMAVVSISPTHQAPHKGALSITVKLQQVNFVQLQSVGRAPGSLLEGVTQKTAAGKLNAGQQSPKKLNVDKAAENAKSVMKATGAERTGLESLSGSSAWSTAAGLNSAINTGMSAAQAALQQSSAAGGDTVHRVRNAALSNLGTAITQKVRQTIAGGK